ncbi:MAG TPA: hypothetical protein ENH52_02855 [Nitrospirae bacterium]|nr:hypothetical protein [Nitrospirota bacterium]
MQIYELIASDRSATHKSLEKFRLILEKKDVWRPIEDIKFVFLCGANINPKLPSKRRQDLIEFSIKNLSHTKFFLAESIFDVLKAEGHKANILDVENELSAFADHIIVVLESESAFCELGAFAANPDLRKKLIVINDINHKDSDSFINIGPIKAINEQSNGKNILFYKMLNEGKISGDGIGHVYNDLYAILHKGPDKRRTRIKECDPNKYFTKDTLRFVHDIVYFVSPITLGEISTIIKILFSASKGKKINNHLGLLCSIKQIIRTDDGYFKSLIDRPFFEYDGLFDFHEMMASFKNLYYRHDRARLKCL